VALILLAGAWAQEPEEIVVIGEATDDPAAGSSQVTVVEVEDLPASADVATAVARAPGVVVRRLGGLGDLAQVGIRGAGARHVEVLIDAIPLNPEGGSAVDLSELPLAAFSRVEVYRGAAPALLGVSALGGAIALVPGEGRGAGLVLAAGSQRAVRGSGTLGLPLPAAGHLWASAEALASQGAFRYLDDGGTRSDPSDDAFVPRQNNDTRSLSTLARWQQGPVSLLHTGTWRDDGVPGFTFAPSLSARYQLDRQLLGLRVRGPVGGSELSARGYGLYRRDRLSDPEDELGVGSGSSVDRTGSLGLDASARVPLSRAVRLDTALGGRLDLYDSAALSSQREVGRVIASLPCAWGPIELVPALIGLGLSREQQAPELFAMPRLGGVARIGAPFTIKANAGAFARPPDLVELYGDRGVLVGNPELRPERGLQGDAGLLFERAQLRLEGVAFLASYRDLIVWTTGPQGVARPENVASALVTGLELAGSAQHGPARLLGQLTLTRAINASEDPTYRGNQLPRQPVAETFLQGGLDGDWVFVQIDASGTAGTWADTANFALQPPRLLLGATTGLRHERSGLALELDVRNLLGARTARVPRDPLVDDGLRVDQPIVDFTGYPLPGRTVWLALRGRFSGSRGASSTPSPSARQ
jgi:vitamin B12 transporter